MPDSPIEPPPAGDYPSHMEARVAVLEQIAKTTLAAVERLEWRLDVSEAGIRTDLHELRTDYRWLLGTVLAGFAGLLGVMAHGFHSL
jgi:hypothetical protein